MWIVFRPPQPAEKPFGDRSFPARWLALHERAERMKRCVIRHGIGSEADVPVWTGLLAPGTLDELPPLEKKVPDTWMSIMNEAVFLDCLKLAVMEPRALVPGQQQECTAVARCACCCQALGAASAWTRWRPATKVQEQMQEYVERRAQLIFP
jgi:hypothetical protein